MGHSRSLVVPGQSQLESLESLESWVLDCIATRWLMAGYVAGADVGADVLLCPCGRRVYVFYGLGCLAPYY